MATKQLVTPSKLKELESKFAATLVVSSLLSKRDIRCTITNLSTQVCKMCNNKKLTLIDLQMMHNIIPSICYIQSVPENANNHNNNNKNDDLYELKFCFPITPNNISKILNKFKNAIINIQQSKKRKLSEQEENDNNRPRKRRKLNNNSNSNNNDNNNHTQHDDDDDLIELNIKPLPLLNGARIKELKEIKFSPLTFIEESKKFTFWNNGNIVSHKLLPLKLPKYDKLNINDVSMEEHKENVYGPTSIRIKQIPSILISTFLRIKNIDIINKLYYHQTNAINSICRGYHNIIATSTSSGKSLCYNIPVLSHIINNNSKSQNLYLFPTKALAQDQLRSLNEIISGIEGIKCATYDGDTPFNIRCDILLNNNIILTNPDIIHLSLLPNHNKYRSLFSNISFIIIDELHSYFSIFGSHFANILRRLKRICSMYGSHPLFIGCSATINNPLQHFSYLIGINNHNEKNINVITNKHDGSAMAQKLFIFWNPPLKKQQKKNNKKNNNNNKSQYFHIENHIKTVQNAINDSKSRRSSFVESAMLFCQCIMSDLRCILFVKQRSVCELIYKYSRDILFKSDINGKNYINLIKSYRGGYKKELRRSIESDLFSNKIKGIISTNAMELGVDIGNLDCTLHCGYSGISSLWQQSGRAGRGNIDNKSLAIFIAQNSVIDQYIINNNNDLFDYKSFENTIIYPYNKKILYSHLLCSIGDEPMDIEEIYKFWTILDHDDEYDDIDKHKKLIREIINDLLNDEKIIYNRCINKWLISPKYLSILAHKLHKNGNYGNSIHPSSVIGIRNIDDITYSVYIEGINEKIDEMNEHNAFFHVFPGAIYLNQGKEYLMTNIDIVHYKSYCKEIVNSSTYYTLSRDRTDIIITNNLFTSIKYNKLIHFGGVEIRTKVFAYYKILKLNGKILDEISLNLPNLIIKTIAFWIDIPEIIINKLNNKKIDIISAIHCIQHCIISLLPLFIKCNSNEFDTECPSPFDKKKRIPRIIISEKIQFGLGYIQQIIMEKNKENLIVDIVNKTIDTLSNCQCNDGCLSCCHSITCHEYNIVSSRKNALILLKMLKPILSKSQ